MSQLSAIKDRLRTITNLRKVTSAMELVTKTKINRLRQNASTARNYQIVFAELFSTAFRARQLDAPKTKKTKNPEQYLVVFFSQKGFCGNFNDKLMSKLNFFLGSNKKINIFLVGKKNSKWNYYIEKYTHLEGKEKNYQKEFEPLLDTWLKSIMKNKDIEIFFLFNHLKTVLEQTPMVKQVYPFSFPETKSSLPLVDPDLETIFPKLLSGYLSSCLEQAYWESVGGENCARLLSMKNANDNAAIIIDSLHLLYNKTRQTKITQELSEIVSAFDVLELIKDKKEKEGA